MFRNPNGGRADSFNKFEIRIANEVVFSSHETDWEWEGIGRNEWSMYPNTRSHYPTITNPGTWFHSQLFQYWWAFRWACNQSTEFNQHRSQHAIFKSRPSKASIRSHRFSRSWRKSWRSRRRRLGSRGSRKEFLTISEFQRTRKNSKDFTKLTTHFPLPPPSQKKIQYKSRVRYTSRRSTKIFERDWKIEAPSSGRNSNESLERLERISKNLSSSSTRRLRALMATFFSTTKSATSVPNQRIESAKTSWNSRPRNPLKNVRECRAMLKNPETPLKNLEIFTAGQKPFNSFLFLRNKW